MSPAGPLMLFQALSRKSPHWTRVTLGAAACLLLGAAWLPAGRTVQGAVIYTETDTPEFYTARVQPILQANCYRCHAGLNHRGGLLLDTEAGLRKGGHDGAVLVPGHPSKGRSHAHAAQGQTLR